MGISCLSAANAWVTPSTGSSVRQSTSLNAASLWFSTSTGNTETIAGYIAEAAGLELDGKKVAIFGCGDQESYTDYYCDAAGELYDQFTAKGCKVYGMTSTEGYNHAESKAEQDGKFVGLLCDEDNQYDESEGRAKAWIAQLKDEGFF